MTDIHEVKEELLSLRLLLEQLAAALMPAAQSRPLTAEELMARWAVPGETEQHRLDNLAKRCRRLGLRSMRGTRGMAATYMVADVQAAEAYGNGTIKRKRRAV